MTYTSETYQKLRDGVSWIFTQAKYDYDVAGKKVLEIAPDEHDSAKKLWLNADVDTLSIKPGEDIQADICARIPVDPKTYDCILCFEVLEHTFEPQAAINNMYKALKTGGHLYLSTPFMFREHGPRPDLWRFTSEALHHMLAAFRGVDLYPNPLPQVGDPNLKGLAPIGYRVKAKK